MENPFLWQLLLQAVLILLNAVFACAEIAVISMNDMKLEQLAAQGDRRAIRLSRLTLRDIKQNNPTVEELTAWYRKSGLPLKKFFNTSGLQYKALGLKDKLTAMSEDEQLALLATDGMLVKRPLLVGEDFVLTGFRAAEWEARLG